MPLAPPEFSDGADIPISFLQCGRRPWTQLGVASRWDEHPHSLSLTLRMSGLVNTLGIVGTICRDGGQLIVDLPEQGGNPSAIMRSTTGEIRGDDLASARVHRKVQLPPGPVFRWLPQIANVNPEAGAVDEQVDGPMACDRTKRELTKRLEPPRQGRVVGNGELHLKHLCQGTQESFGLSERKVKDHADRQRCLNRDLCVDALAAGLATRRGPPGVESVIGQPDCEVTKAA